MIRKVTNNDRDRYIELATEFYSSDAVLHPIPKEHIIATFEELMRSEDLASCYFFEVEGNIAGYSLLAHTFSQEAGGEVIWIEEIYVRDAYRSHGLGKEFFKFIEETKSPRVKRIRLEVEEDNEKAVALYRRLGFEPLEYDQMVKDFR